MEKRGRKLVDYDSHRHNYEALQNNTKKRDQTKIARQHEVLEEARRTFELMNNELYDELPALYDSRYTRRGCAVTQLCFVTPIHTHGGGVLLLGYVLSPLKYVERRL